MAKLSGNLNGPLAFGVAGPSAYEVAVKNGFLGSEEAWLESLRGKPFTYEDFTEKQLAALKGGQGDPGKDGKDGKPGEDGSDGFSPVIKVEKAGKVTTITITDAKGTYTAKIQDGADGQNGKDGEDGKDSVGIAIYRTTADLTDELADGIYPFMLSELDTHDGIPEVGDWIIDKYERLYQIADAYGDTFDGQWIATLNREGGSGEDGGYYIPNFELLESKHLKISYTPSKEGMPEISDRYFEMPSGGNVENGEDGFSPIATVTQTNSGAVISITDKTGTTTATITNGKDGKDGADGQPGKDGADGAPGEKGDKGDKGDPGEPGQKGEQGEQGIPGEKGEKGEPGKDGADGKDGTSATHSWNGTVLTITSASGTSSADLKGAKGDKGDKGDTGERGIQGEPGATGAAGKDGVDGKDYVLTDGDRAEIAAMVIEMLGGEPVFGYVDENGNIIVQGNLPDGTYSVKYEIEDGSTIDIGDLVLDSNVYYSVTNQLTNCTNSNGASEVIGGQSYSAVITANDGYELSSVTVTMGGNPVTVSGGSISIAEVTGNIVITAVATESVVTPTYTNLAVPDANASGQTAWESGGWCNDSYMAGSSYAYRVATDGRITTNTFAVEHGDIIYVKGIKYSEGSDCQLAGFDSSGAYIKHASVYNMGGTSQGYVKNLTGTVGEDYWYFTNVLKSSGGDNSIRFIRLAGKPSGSISDIIITRNQPIV